MFSLLRSEGSSRRTVHGAVAMLGRGIIWGGASAVLSTLTINPFVVIGLIGLVQGPILMGVGMALGQKPLTAIRAVTVRRLLLFVSLETGGFGCFCFALQRLPAGLVIAIGFTAPVLLMLIGILGGRRALNVKTISSLLSLVAALIVMGVTVNQGGSSHTNAWLGLLAVCASAVFAACNLSLLQRHAHRMSTFTTPGLLALGAGALTSPLTITIGIPSEELTKVVLVGVITVPAVILFVVGIKRLQAVAVGSIDLLQLFWVGIAVYWLYDQKPDPGHIIAAILIVAAVYLELTEGSKNN